jgi:DNA-binding GntR family transcriptional regulator
MVDVDDRHGRPGAGKAEVLGLSPVASISRRNAVMNEIRRAVVLGHLAPGAKLTENRLSASLNVSRPTMREALAQLAQEGLIIQEPYRGLRVADPDPGAILDIARTRVALDMLAAQDVLADPIGGRLERVRAAWSSYSKLPFDADPMEAHEAHIDFHRRIWEASENTLLMRLWPVTEGHLTIVLAHDQATQGTPRRAAYLHERLVEAIGGGDLDQVHDALVAHTMDPAEELAAILTANLAVS